MIPHSEKNGLAIVARRVVGGLAIIVYAVLVAAVVDATEDPGRVSRSEPGPARRVAEIVRALRPARGTEAPLTASQALPEGWPLWPVDDHAHPTR